MSVNQVFLRTGEKQVNLFFFFLLHMLYGLLPVSVMRVFVFWCCWPCISGPATVGCSSLSGAERVLNLDVIQGEGRESQRIEASGRPFVNKGMISGKLNTCCFPDTFPRDLLPCPELTVADGNKPGIRRWAECCKLTSLSELWWDLNIYVQKCSTTNVSFNVSLSTYKYRKQNF